MNKTYFLKGIILNRRPLRERDSQVFVYTDRSGYLDLVVRGTQDIKSKLAGHIEPFNQIDMMVIKGKKWDYLGAVTAKNVFKNLKNNSDKLLYSGELFRYLIQLIKPGISDEYIYSLILEYLVLVDNKKLTVSPEYLSRLALLKIISHLGHQPMLGACVLCGKKGISKKIRFNPEKNGIICASCYDSSYSFAVSLETVNQLKENIKLSLSNIINIKINKNIEQESTKIIDAFYKYNF
ncbi:MAG: DNA repair protein RecO [Patescibacteria group bacterium]|nr:DNA repair protein RecO [Patescibacteria group bacterium]